MPTIGLSMTTVLGAAGRGGRLRVGPGGGARRRLRGHDRPAASRLRRDCERRRGRLGPAASEADLGRPVDEVDRRQVVPLHQADEVMDPLDVEWVGRPRGVLRHSFTPAWTILSNRCLTTSKPERCSACTQRRCRGLRGAGKSQPCVLAATGAIGPVSLTSGLK